ncbi:alpha/beta hydrolase [Thermosulfuriphilus sp.]
MERPAHLKKLTFFDQSGMSRYIFHPKRGQTPAPPGAKEVLIPGAAGKLKAHFYPGSPEMPTILCLHDDGENLQDYALVGQAAQQAELNFFVFDFRGYGESPGAPSFSGLLEDAHRSLAFCRDYLPEAGRPRPIVIMGKGLGTVAALELGCHYGQEVAAVILASPFVSCRNFLVSRGIEPVSMEQLPEGIIEDYVSRLLRPILVIHAQHDRRVPLSEVEKFLMYAQVGNKRLMIIPAETVDLALMGEEAFFQMISDFLHWLRPKKRRSRILH